MHFLQSKDARLTAEAGTAFIISEWNRPANRRLYTGLPMGSWESAKNRCTAPSPTYEVANASNPTLQATSFKNGAEVSLPSSSNDTTRSFKLIRATFTPGSAAGRGTPLGHLWYKNRFWSYNTKFSRCCGRNLFSGLWYKNFRVGTWGNSGFLD